MSLASARFRNLVAHFQYVVNHKVNLNKPLLDLEE